jgi:hypothetical protein
LLDRFEEVFVGRRFLGAVVCVVLGGLFGLVGEEPSETIRQPSEVSTRLTDRTAAV